MTYLKNRLSWLVLIGLLFTACAPSGAATTPTIVNAETSIGETPQGTLTETEVSETATPSPEAQTTPTEEATATPVPALNDDNLTFEQIGGLTEPASIAVIGPGDLFVTEKSTGRVMRVQNGQVGEPVLDLATNYFDERGALGITLHPDFATNNFVYVYWTWTGKGEEPDGLLGEDSEVAEEVPALGNRVDRFVWNGSQLTFDQNIVTLRSNTLNTDTSGRVRGNHDGGVITFGPDGKMYVIIGDQNLRGYLQNVGNGEPPTAETLAGVILRLNDDGSVPADNPFAAAGGELAKVYVYGIRNSFGLTFDPLTGNLWESENGDDAYDELNRFEAGDNSGWIQLMGSPDRFADWKQLEADSEDGFDNPGFPPDQLAADETQARERLFQIPDQDAKYKAPVFQWKYPVAVTAVGFVPGEVLGADYAGDLLVGDVLTGNLIRFDLAEDRETLMLTGDLGDGVADNADKGDMTETEALIFASGLGTVTDIEFDVDGSLWIASLSTNSLFHITGK